MKLEAGIIVHALLYHSKATETLPLAPPGPATPAKLGMRIHPTEFVDVSDDHILLLTANIPLHLRTSSITITQA